MASQMVSRVILLCLAVLATQTIANAVPADWITGETWDGQFHQYWAYFYNISAENPDGDITRDDYRVEVYFYDAWHDPFGPLGGSKHTDTLSLYGFNFTFSKDLSNIYYNNLSIYGTQIGMIGAYYRTMDAGGATGNGYNVFPLNTWQPYNVYRYDPGINVWGRQISDPVINQTTGMQSFYFDYAWDKNIYWKKGTSFTYFNISIPPGDYLLTANVTYNSGSTNDLVARNHNLYSVFVSKPFGQPAVVGPVLVTYSTVDFNKDFYQIGEQMDISWNLINPDFANNFYAIKLLKPTSDYAQSWTVETVTNITSTTGTWSPSHDKTTYGIRKAWLVYQAKTGGPQYLMDEDTADYGAVTPTEVTGSVTTDKNDYVVGENVNITYSLNTAGRLHIKQDSLACTGLLGGKCEWVYTISAPITNATLLHYLPSDMSRGNYKISVEYQYLGFWTVVAEKTITVGGGNIWYVNILKSTYNIGDLLAIEAWGPEAGRLVLKDSTNITRIYVLTLANYSEYRSYQIQSADPSGIWTANLYNSSDILMASDTATIYAAAVTPTPTIGATPTVVMPTATVTYGAYPGGSGVAWTASDIIMFLRINIPLLFQLVFLFMILTILFSLNNFINRGRQPPQEPPRW